MARDYGKISTSLWMSRKFRSLKADDRSRLLYCYLHSCPTTNSIGCFVLPKGYACTDLNWSETDMDRAIKALCDASLITWNASEELVRVIGFLEHSPLTNVKHAKGAIKLALSLPDSDEKTNVCNDLLSDPWAKNDDDLKRATIGLSKSSDTTEPEPEPDKTVSLRSTGEPRGSADAEPAAPPAEKPIAEILFGSCLRYLTANGVAEKAARPLIGKWRRDYGDGEVAAAIAEAQKDAASEPIGLVTAILQQRRKNAGARASATLPPRYSNASLVSRLLEDIDHDHDSVHAGRNGAALHRTEGAGERDPGPLIPEGHLRLAGPDEAESD